MYPERSTNEVMPPMINRDNNPVAWALLLLDLDEAREHLENLVEQMSQSEDFDEAEFSVHLGHIYAHLNRVWNSRDMEKEIPGDQWTEFSRFPTDLQPVG